MNLFEQAAQEELKKQAPLAVRMRPRTLEEFVGQEKVVGPGTLLRRAIENDTLSSLILWGPPGSGKTTLAYIIANMTKAHFEALHAVLDGITDIRRVVEKAKERRIYLRQKTVVFVDEIHRWAKNIQDALLPCVEEGVITLIGATIENPMFTVNPALRSRSQIFRLDPLREEDILKLLRRALEDKERGLADLNVEAEEEALKHLARVAGGDARIALNALEFAALTTPPSPDGKRYISLAVAEEAVQTRPILYDRDGDQHYDIVSAWIKSIRGSDPDAAIYWLARMIYAGEDPLFLARRLMIHAAEDIGLADPQALVVATAAAQAIERVGLPEGRLILAEATLYLALAPKSNSVYKAIDSALEEVQKGENASVPLHLRDASYPGAKALGHGKGYKYPHNFPGGWVEQRYLPPSLEGKGFYHPSPYGKERDLVRAWQERCGKKPS
ncbi:Recombination protein MgsA [Thermanaeromonas toyohensis ToBE]|uniref:Replication-associated recombination protein A n=1 Tax=Thermanaeromonas toyohensis ToBE TaxID=698762 RepID=A0A1W1W161_9FIRM|nr:replication-associated recombination protein A [Thermanaeromonas toyohensis]SMB98834.1 Recombination protein MgsA [Thermanaeromonas toyohensis ToBE]